MTDAAPAAGAPSPRRWPKILLIVSLVLNALLIGILLRGVWALRTNVALGGGGVEAGLPAFVATLPANRREELRQSPMVTRPAELRPLRVEIRRARMEAARAFTAEPFDKQAFNAAQRRVTEAENRFRTAVQQALSEMGERMTAAERRAFLNWRGHGFGGRRGRGSDYDGEERRDGPPRQRW